MGNQRGFITPVVLLFVVVAALGAVNYFLFFKTTRPAPVDQTSQFQTTSASQESISVPGMSKYTDTDFGFSFWYPSGSTVRDATPFHSDFSKNDQQLLKRFEIAGNGFYTYIDEINSPSRRIDVSGGACGYCGPVSFFFDTSLRTWMKVYPYGPNGAPDATPEQIAAAKVPKPADVSNNTIGGLHIFNDEQKEGGVYIPLSAQHFLYVTGYLAPDFGQYDYQRRYTNFVKTIVATDPSVATPVSAAEQIKTIQAEKDAYGEVMITASPITGSAPLEVAFTLSTTKLMSYKLLMIDFGDGQTTGVCDPDSKCLSNPYHPYTKAGSYTATLKSADNMTILGQVTITVK